MERILRELNVAALLRAWPDAFPNIPPPSNSEALKTLHLARVKSKRMTPAERAYSAEWLADRDVVMAQAVGISVNSKHAQVKSAIHDAMRQAVIDSGDAAPHIVRANMQAARLRERRGLGLTTKPILPES